MLKRHMDRLPYPKEDHRLANRRWAGAAALAVTNLTILTPTLCAPKNVSMDSVFNKFVDIICTVAFYVGALIIIGGIVNWILANKDENADGQSRAIKFLVCGIVLVSLKTVIQPILGLL